MMFYIAIAATIAVTIITYHKSYNDKPTNAMGAFICTAFLSFFILGMSSIFIRSAEPETLVKSERVYTIAPGSQAEIGDNTISLAYVDDQGVTKAIQSSFDSLTVVTNPTEIVIQDVSYEYGTAVLPWGMGDVGIEVIAR